MSKAELTQDHTPIPQNKQAKDNEDDDMRKSSYYDMRKIIDDRDQ
jgi:hypothetical protein